MSNIIEIAYSELDNWLDSVDENLPESPYKLKITGITTKGNLQYIVQQFNNRDEVYVDLSETILPESITDFSNAFRYMYTLVKAPAIPITVTNMSDAFWGCTSLVEAPIIPEGVTNMSGTFFECTSLVEVPNIPSTVIYMSDTFHDCELQNINEWNVVVEKLESYKDCFDGVPLSSLLIHVPKDNYDSWVDFANELGLTSDNFVAIDDGTIKFSELDNWLKSQSSNTPETAYELKITGLTKEDLISASSQPSSLGRILNSNPTKYVDLSETILPEGVTSMANTFRTCASLAKSPNIPSTVTDMNFTFFYCTSLVEAPVIPECVTEMSHTFERCTSLVEAPVIPNTVTDMGFTFSNCSSLVKAPIIPSTVTNMSSTFADCASLVKAPNIPESVINMNSTFRYCKSLVEAPVIHEGVTYMYTTFQGCTSLKSLTFSNSKIIQFNNAIDKQLDFIKFDYDLKNVEYVKNMKTLDAKLIITNDECLETIKDYFPNKNVHSILKWARLV